MITIKFKHIAYLGLAFGLYWLFSHVGLQNKTTRYQCLDKGVIGDRLGHPTFYVVLKSNSGTYTEEYNDAEYYVHYKIGKHYTETKKAFYWKK